MYDIHVMWNCYFLSLISKNGVLLFIANIYVELNNMIHGLSAGTNQALAQQCLWPVTEASLL